MPFKSPIFHGKYCFALLLSLPLWPSGIVFLLKIVFHDPSSMCNRKKNSIFRLTPITKTLQFSSFDASRMQHHACIHKAREYGARLQPHTLIRVWTQTGKSHPPRRCRVFFQDVIGFGHCCTAPSRTTFRHGRIIVPIEGAQCTIHYWSLTSWAKTKVRHCHIPRRVNVTFTITAVLGEKTQRCDVEKWGFSLWILLL